MSAAAAQTRLIAKEVVQAVEFSVNDIKIAVGDIKNDIKVIKDQRWTDFMWHLATLIAAVLAIGAAIISIYFRLEDKISAISTTSTRIETKLEVLLAPVQTTLPRH
jgi:hypothetical protein